MAMDKPSAYNPQFDNQTNQGQAPFNPFAAAAYNQDYGYEPFQIQPTQGEQIPYQPYPTQGEQIPYQPYPINTGLQQPHQAYPMSPVQATTARNPDGSSDSDSHTMDVNNAESHETNFKFSEKSIRLGFVKKVFGLLFFQLLITAGLMCIFLFIKPVKNYMIANDWVYITSICLTIVCTCVFAFVTKLRKLWPANLICLIIITLVMSTMLGSIAVTMEVDEILISVGIVCAVVLVCAILGFQKKFDFTPLVGFVAMLGMILFSFGFLCIFYYSQVMTIVYSSLGALLFALWLLLDIQLILGGRHKLAFDPEDYVGGALTMYVDIIYMLMMIFFIFKAT